MNDVLEAKCGNSLTFVILVSSQHLIAVLLTSPENIHKSFQLTLPCSSVTSVSSDENFSNLSSWSQNSLRIQIFLCPFILQSKSLVDCIDLLFFQVSHALSNTSLNHEIYFKLMKRTLPRPRNLQFLHRLLNCLLPLSFKILRPDIVNMIPLRIVLLALVARDRMTARPGNPRHWTPSIPKCWFHVVGKCVPGFAVVAVVCIWLLGCI